MTKIYLCSPYKGNKDCPAGVKGHVKDAQTICHAIVSENVLPLAPHLYLPRFLDDNVPHERELGCKLGLELLRGCQGMVVYEGCCGMSSGMLEELKAVDSKLPIFYLYNLSIEDLKLAREWAGSVGDGI